MGLACMTKFLWWKLTIRPQPTCTCTDRGV